MIPKKKSKNGSTVLHMLNGLEGHKCYNKHGTLSHKRPQSCCGSGPWKVTACELLWSGRGRVIWNQQKVVIQDVYCVADDIAGN